MKITILHGGCFPVPPRLGGAVEKIWFALAKEFARRGHRVTQISRTFADLPNRQFLDGVEHRRIPGYERPLRFPLLFLRELWFSFRALAVLPTADLIVTHSITAPLLIRKKRWGRLYVHVARFPKGQMRWYRHARRLQTVSHAVADALLAQAPELAPQVTVIRYPHGQEHLTLDPQPEKTDTILFAGRVHPEKGVHLLLEAFARLPETVRSTWRLIIAGSAETAFGGGGSSYRQQLETLAQRVPGRVTFLGHIENATRLARLYAEARLFVYPSLAATGETFGAAPLEALYWGTPVLVSQLACFKEFLREGHNGWSVACSPEGSCDALSEKLSFLLAHPDELQRASTVARSTTERFSLSSVAADYLADFERLVSV